MKTRWIVVIAIVGLVGFFLHYSTGITEGIQEIEIEVESEMVVQSLLKVLAILVSIVVFLYYTAKTKTHASFTKSEEMDLVVSGGKLIKVLLNSNTHYVEQKTFEIKPYKEGDPHIGGYLERELGFYYVSWMYPLQKILKFELTVHRLKPEIEKNEDNAPEKLKDWLEYDTITVRSLRQYFSHYIVVEGIELRDRWRVDFMIVVYLEVTNPYKAVMTYHAKFLQIINSAIRGATIDWAKNMDYSKLIDQDKGPNSNFVSGSRAINEGGVADESVKGSMEASVHEMIGIRATTSYVYNLRLSNPELDKAAQAEQVEEYLAAAEKQKGVGQRDRDKLIAEGRAAIWREPVKALIDLKVDPNQAALRVASVDRSRELGGDSNITTLVDGESKNAVVALTPEDKKEKGGKE